MSPRSRSLLRRSVCCRSGRRRSARTQGGCRRRSRNATRRSDCARLLEILDHAADRIRTRGDVFRWPVGEMIERIELRGSDRLEMQEAVGQCLDTRWIVELAPFGAQRGDLVALVTHLAAQFG